MTAVVTCSLKLTVAFLITQVAALDLNDVQHFPEETQEMALSLGEASTCAKRLWLPLTAMLIPEIEPWTYLCGDAFFIGCRAEFSERCGNHYLDCSSTVYTVAFYEGWLDALAGAGRNYTCGLGLQTINDVLRNGGYECIYQSGAELLSNIAGLVEYIWEAKPFQCEDMQANVGLFMGTLHRCSDSKLHFIVQNYFNQVWESSPCAHPR